MFIIKRIIKMSLFIKCTLRWQIWTNKKLLLVLLHCEVMANFWRQFDKQIAVSTQIVSMCIVQQPSVAWSRWTLRVEQIPLSHSMLICNHAHTLIYLFVSTPSFSFLFGKRTCFPLFFLLFRSNMLKHLYGYYNKIRDR